MVRQSTILLLASALAIAGLMLSGCAQTQPGHTGQKSTDVQSASKHARQQSSGNFSRALLQKFAEANAEIRKIRKNAKQKVKRAENMDKRLRLRQQARQRSKSAIKKAGLSVKEYSRISRAARSNPELARRIKQMQ